MKKEDLLTKFECEKEPFLLFCGDGIDECSDDLLKILKAKELTYVDAYAVLELTYKKLKYESNFTFLK